MNAEEREERAKTILQTLHNIETTEGIFVSDETKSDTQAFVEGEIDIIELTRRIQNRMKVGKKR